MYFIGYLVFSIAKSVSGPAGIWAGLAGGGPRLTRKRAEVSESKRICNGQ